VNPAARLVQTEDLGHTHSTPLLAYQARFDNERRWLSVDLLCGRVGRRHPLYRWLLRAGAGEDELAGFREEPCPPDLLGINHYVSSERFLDERLEHYPAHVHGGNGRHAYADVEAPRVPVPLAGPRALLVEAWRRYGLPLAVTEAHMGCTREEQMRWLVQVWRAATAARADGADLRAVTVWSLLGAFDWNSMCTRRAGFYEPGVFDVRGPRPRPTALAGVVRDLAAGREPIHPALAGPGWWERPERLRYPAPAGPAEVDAAEEDAA
jgi:dTDP-4-dehydrorhamnose reductase